MATSTVVVAREDLTIHGALEASPGEPDPVQIEDHFFNTIVHHNADAVVLDLTGSHEQGVMAIRRIRQRSSVPIVVVCSPEDKSMADYRRAGAAACMTPPVDLMQLKETLEQAEQKDPELPFDGPSDGTESLNFSGFVLWPREQRLIGPNGAEVNLSSAESRVLQHLAGAPGVVWPATAIAEAVGPDQRDNGDRAVGSVIARLRKKLGVLAGPDGQRLIKTEIGRGYMLTAEAVSAWPAAFPARSA
jgi:two-component system OmpR family response regulator